MGRGISWAQRSSAAMMCGCSTKIQRVRLPGRGCVHGQGVGLVRALVPPGVHPPEHRVAGKSASRTRQGRSPTVFAAKLKAGKGCTVAQVALGWLLAQGQDIGPVPRRPQRTARGRGRRRRAPQRRRKAPWRGGLTGLRSAVRRSPGDHEPQGARTLQRAATALVGTLEAAEGSWLMCSRGPWWRAVGHHVAA